MKVKIKRNELMGILSGISVIRSKKEVRKIGKDDKEVAVCWPVFFEHALNRNRDAIVSELKSLERERATRMVPYDTDMRACAKKYCDLDDKGNIVVVQGVPKIKDGNKEQYDKEVQELQNKHAILINEMEKFYEDEIEINLFTVEYSRIENLALPSGAFEVIAPIITGIPKE